MTELQPTLSIMEERMDRITNTVQNTGVNPATGTKGRHQDVDHREMTLTARHLIRKTLVSVTTVEEIYHMHVVLPEENAVEAVENLAIL